MEQVIGRKKLMTMLASAGGVLPMNKVWLADRFPEMFKSNETAKREAAAKRLAGRLLKDLSETPLIDYGCGFTAPHMIEYRLPSLRGGRAYRAVSMMPDKQAVRILEFHHLEEGIQLVG